jgi:hypothetical protein|nr:MAG TPA: hypothetical protein [Caudoviricetes sp.]
MTREEVKAQLAKCPLEWRQVSIGRNSAGVEVLTCSADLVEMPADTLAYYTIREFRHMDTKNIVTATLSMFLEETNPCQYPPYEISVGCTPDTDYLKNMAEAHRLDLICRLLGVKE